MCRMNCLWAGMLTALGVGIIIGLWLEGGFFSHCLGVGFIFCGCGFFRKH